jgi:hypothetical protein
MQDLSAGFARESHVEDDDVVLLRYGPRLTVVSVGHEIDAPSLLLKAPFDELSDGRVVFDYEDSHRGGMDFWR